MRRPGASIGRPRCKDAMSPAGCSTIRRMHNKTPRCSIDPNKCDDTVRPVQRQECYNDACKGVWRVGEWSEVCSLSSKYLPKFFTSLRDIIRLIFLQCTASCEKDGIKYRILQCVWYGTKKPAGNACRDIPRPPVMKTCRGPACIQTPGE